MACAIVAHNRSSTRRQRAIVSTKRCRFKGRAVTRRSRSANCVIVGDSSPHEGTYWCRQEYYLYIFGYGGWARQNNGVQSSGHYRLTGTRASRATGMSCATPNMTTCSCRLKIRRRKRRLLIRRRKQRLPIGRRRPRLNIRRRKRRLLIRRRKPRLTIRRPKRRLPIR